jgi:DNA-binding IclR family transcriptional regulator
MATSLSVERALIILRHLSHSDEALGIRELSRKLGFSPSVVQKIMNALNEQDFVAQDEQTKRYELGSAALQIGLAMLRRLEVRQVARPYLETLTGITGETALLGIKDRDDVFYVDKVLPDSELRMDAPLGASRPYHCTAVGKVLFAFSVPIDFDRISAAGDLEQRTPNTITATDRLFEEFQRIRERGYALDEEEFKLGVRCVAAPVYNHDARVVAAVALSGPAGRIQTDLDLLVEQVLATSHEVSAHLGYREEAQQPVVMA